MNKKATFRLLTLTFLLSSFLNKSVAQSYSTHTYFENDSMKLELDLFLPESERYQKFPLVIYVHGGGFSKGSRPSGHKLAKYLVKNEIACASISYTLYMKGKDFGCNGIVPEKIKAIRIAASQLWKSTAYLIDPKNEFPIDSNKIFIAGYSAGAETVLHGAYWNRSKIQMFGRSLSDGFSYAGVISGAGAIVDINLVSKETLIPLLTFHGKIDPLVPYATAAHHYCDQAASGWLMMFGSETIVSVYKKLEESYDFYSFEKGDHSAGAKYIYRKQKPILDFVNKVLQGEKFQNVFEK